MSIMRNPKAYLWLGRLVPAVAWSFWLAAVLTPDFGPSKSFGMGLLFLLWVLSLGVYILWVYFLLPQLLFEGAYRGMGLRVGYFMFAGFTAGFGPVVWYFLRVDRTLRQMAASRTEDRGEHA